MGKKLFISKLIKSQEGSILAIALFSLLVLSILGTFALNTSDFETKIAANQQIWERNFNISEGGSTEQGTKVGYAGVLDSSTGSQIAPWYQLSDPSNHNDPLVPPTLSDYDPSQSDGDASNDDLATGFSIPSDSDIASDPDKWPRDNLVKNLNDDVYDYAYLVTYLYPDTGSKKLPGYGAGTATGYKFKLNGRRKVDIEMGGVKIGVVSPE